jgi:hypothetical protein
VQFVTRLCVGSERVARWLAQEWLLGGLRAVAGDVVDEVLAGPSVTWGRPSPGERDPWGPPDALFGALSGAWLRSQGVRRGDPDPDGQPPGRLVFRGGALSPRRLRWMLSQDRPLPQDMTAWACRLDGRGFPPWPFNQSPSSSVSMTPGLVVAMEHRLLICLSTPRDLQTGLSHLRAVCTGNRQVMGYAAPPAAWDTLPLERLWPLPQPGRDWFIRRGHTVLTGYSWVTVVPADLAEQITEARLAQARRDLFHVEVLPSGSLWLQACETAEGYDDAAVRAMFLAVVDILPDVQPLAPDETDRVRHPTVNENAADYRPR